MRRRRLHYSGDYRVRAAAVRAAAYADPLTRCWRSGLTLAEAQVLWPDKVIKWHAGHVVDGDPYSPLRAELSYVNEAAGARLSNDRRRLRTSREW